MGFKILLGQCQKRKTIINHEKGQMKTLLQLGRMQKKSPEEIMEPRASYQVS